MAVRRISTQTLTGALIVIVGLLLLLSTTGVYETGSLWQWVPSLFILLGVWAIVSSDFQNLTGPIGLIVIATIAQLLALDLVTLALLATWWPLFIILVGVIVILGRYTNVNAKPFVGRDLDLFAFFGGIERRVSAEQFEGGSITVAFGGVDVDLRDTTVVNPPAHINVMSAFGGATFKVPEDWTVDVAVLPIFGATEDARRRPARDAELSSTPTLRITGWCAFGGITVED